MSFCGKCGAEKTETDQFCGECGAKNQNAPSQKDISTTIDSQTPSYSPAEREYKSVGPRFFAQLIDGLILFLPLLIVFLTLGYLVGSMTGNIKEDGNFELHGLPALFVMSVVFLIGILYFAVMETFRDGQTFGKKMIRIQVVTADNSPLTFKASFIRNILRFADGMLFYLVGAVFIWTSQTRQRLGDRIANTYVVAKDTTQENQSKPEPKKKSKILSLLSNKDDTVFVDMD